VIIKLTTSHTEEGAPLFIAADSIAAVTPPAKHVSSGRAHALISRKGDPEEYTYAVTETVEQVVEAWSVGLSCSVLNVVPLAQEPRQ